MPKRKKSSLSRSTQNAKRMKETRSNEDENLFFQRLEKEKIGGPLKGKMKLLSIMLIECLYINIRKNCCLKQL